MKNTRTIAALILLLIAALPARADFPVAQTPIKIPYHDVYPAVAYNSTNDEYLVVWTSLFPWPNPTDPTGIIFPWAGWVLGQRVSASGSPIGDWFVIFANWMVVKVSVAYNSTNNDYMVVAAYGNPPEIWAQRVGNTGTLIGSAQVVLSNVLEPKILFNPLAEKYLVLGDGSGPSPLKGIFSRVLSVDGTPAAAAVAVTYKVDDTLSNPDYSVAFAPIVSPETPQGRYLLARSTTWLTMLDSDGKPMITWFDLQGNPLLEEIPFSKRTSSETTGSVAFGTQWGYGGGGPSGAFMMAYGAKAGNFMSKGITIAYPGIWASFVNPDIIAYYGATPGNTENCFPVSWIYQDAFYLPYIDSWRPAVDYNPTTGKFFVVWRETPAPGPNSTVQVNHIRGDCALRNGGAPPNSANFVLSATNGTENPQYPVVASSTKDGRVLAVWVDMRDSVSYGSEIYGTVFDISQALPIQLASFKALPKAGSSVLLEWTTLSETNNYGFEVQRRPEGTPSFQSLPGVFIAGHGTTTTPQNYSYTDVTLSSGRWWYRLKQTDLDNTVHYSEPVSALFTGDGDGAAAPKEIALHQNYPNPFNPTTRIAYDLPKPAHVTLVVYDMLGREVVTLANGWQEAGFKSVALDATSLASGIYFYRLQVHPRGGGKDVVATKRLSVVR